MSAKFIVIGGANADLYGQITQEKEIFADSNLGAVSIHPGGVGRNIAENLGHLGAEVDFIGHFGGDEFAKMLKFSLENAGVSVNFSYSNTNKKSDFYLAIHDKQGELVSAVNDMGLVESLPTSFLNEDNKLQAIYNAQLIILDGNLSDDLLAKIFNSFGDNSIIAVDTVSSMKAQRFIPYLSKINLIKCNRAEANILISAEEHLSLQQISEKLMYSGIGTAIVSDSLDGFIVSTRTKFKLFKAKKFESSNSSGAGDALFSGFLYAICKGKTSFEAAEFGISLAEKTLEISGPVNPEVSELGKTLR